MNLKKGFESRLSRSKACWVLMGGFCRRGSRGPEDGDFGLESVLREQAFICINGARVDLVQLDRLVDEKIYETSDGLGLDPPAYL